MAEIVERPASALTHKEASAVFELAERQPVRIKRRGDKPDEILMLAEDFEGMQRFARNMVVLAKGLRVGEKDLPAVEGLLWTKALSLEDRRKMLGELVEAARSAAERADFWLFNATWKGWESAAGLESDPAAQRALLRPVDYSALVKLARP